MLLFKPVYFILVLKHAVTKYLGCLTLYASINNKHYLQNMEGE